jgi:shikimate kinase
MGTGKTSVGRALAAALKKGFIDTDEIIEKRAGKSISRIFAEDGERAFRDAESAVAVEVAGMDGMVVSTGGGIVLRRENMSHLRKNGIIINLTSSPSKIYERLKNDGGSRPLLAKPDVPSEIKKLLAEREPFYADCDVRIDTGHLSAETAAKDIIRGLAGRI